MSEIIVPVSMEEIIQRFDANKDPFDEFAISGELNAARSALVDPSDAEAAGAWAEVLAFALSAGQHENPWNSYFGPMGSGTDRDGKTVYFPDISGTLPNTIDHWAARARLLKHPFLKARYADLAWEMSGTIGKRRRSIDDARIAVDGYLDALPRMAEDHEHMQFAVRALDLSVLIGDKDRTDQARAELMGVHRSLMQRKGGLWGRAVDRLLEDKKAGVTDAERAELTANLERIVTTSSNVGNPAQFNPHEAKDAAERLVRYYRRLGKSDEIKRLHEAGNRKKPRRYSLVLNARRRSFFREENSGRIAPDVGSSLYREVGAAVGSSKSVARNRPAGPLLR